MILFNYNKYAYIKKSLNDKKWVKNKIQFLLNCSEELNMFYHFECSSFFRGYLVASKNLKWYEKRMKQIERQLKFLNSYERIRKQN